MTGPDDRSRDATTRRIDGLRNTLWFCRLRRPAPSALRRTLFLARTVPATARRCAPSAQHSRAPRVIRERRVVPPAIEQRLTLFEKVQRHSTARRYVG
ncbi:hypothetical protein AB0903_13270 [Streptomyces sp. NPDC048389]|uniref:hypothetical protein n=1 Tax=Streptomyces sp. NPDC048389 TaxID=3154622 RepID=UPI0034562E49